MVGQQVSAEELQLVQEFHTILRAVAPKPHAFRRCIGALTAVAMGLSACAPATESERLNRRTLAQSNAILDDLARTELMLSPETATRLGIETVAEDAISSRLADHSQAGFERARLIRIDLLALARTRPLLPADHQVAKDLAVSDTSIARLVQLQAIGHGRLTLSRARAYAIDPFSGVWIEGPNLLANDHRIDSFADAQNYLARLQALSDAIDDTRRRLLADADAGLIPPAPLLQATKRKVDALLSSQDEPLELLADTIGNLVQSLADTDDQDVGALVRQSETIVKTDLRGAYTRLSDDLDAMIDLAPAQAGIWAQPNGHNTYQALLDWYVGSTPDLDELHQSNLDDVERRQAVLHASLDRNGVAPGPVTDRVQALQLIIDTPPETTPGTSPAGAREAELPAAEIPVISSTVQRLFETTPLSGLSYLPAQIDGHRPAQISQMVTQTQLWPSYMRSTIYAEADMARRDPFATLSRQRRATVRNLILYPAFQDAWRLYTFEIQTELSALDTAQDAGEAQYILLITALAAADTGLHYKRWSLAQTTTYLSETTGLPDALVTEAALRITANPGRTTARMINYRRLKALNARARAVLGRRYDETAFQAILLEDGPRPFTMIEHDVDAWYNNLLAPVD